MGLDNPIHIAFLLILLLLVFGAKRLPEMGKSLGSGMRGFKEALSGEEQQHTLVAQQQQAAVAPMAAPVTAAPVTAAPVTSAPVAVQVTAEAPVVVQPVREHIHA